ncbi:hypothetical protein G9O61_00g022420 [Vairimorpha ceranae]|nr:hypothetical protein G9O61_00g022420 [Vairimorpha ceranae]
MDIPYFWVGHLKTIIKICVKRSDVINFNKPLDKEILEIIYGSLLGDASAENVKEVKVLEYYSIKKVVIMNIYYFYID